MIIDIEIDILSRVFQALAEASSSEEIMAIASTAEENDRIAELAEKNRKDVLSVEEKFEINQYILAEQYVRLAKAHAHIRMKNKAA